MRGAEQTVDAVVNVANLCLWRGGGMVLLLINVT